MNYVPAVVLTVGIAILSLTESTNMPSVRLNDKAIHGLFYTLLALSWLVPAIKQGSKNPNFQTFKLCVATCVGTTAYGALLEVLQHYCTLTRSGEWLDVLADFIGALIGVGIVVLLRIVNCKL